jgi:hypothetical protein
VIGTIAIVDLRLLDCVQAPLRAGQVLPWTWGAFALAVVPAAPVHQSGGGMLRQHRVWIKMCVLVLAGINMLVFELITVRGVATWDREPTPPLPARLAGGISLACWALVVTFGRWTGFTMLPE